MLSELGNYFQIPQEEINILYFFLRPLTLPGFSRENPCVWNTKLAFERSFPALITKWQAVNITPTRTSVFGAQNEIAGLFN